MNDSGEPRSVDPFTFWYLLAAFGILLLVRFMVTDALGVTSSDEPSAVYTLQK